MEDLVRIVRKVTSPFRRINRAKEEYNEYLSSRPRNKLFIVVGDGLPTGETYIRKQSMDWITPLAVYGDDMLIAYNNYRKAKQQNGNIPNRSGLRKTTGPTIRRNSI